MCINLIALCECDLKIVFNALNDSKKATTIVNTIDSDKDNFVINP